MPNLENGFHRENSESQLDSLNSDVVEVTQVEVDNTVRPMRASLRQRLNMPSTVPSPPESGQDEKSA
jgi:hypothetical protein